MRIKRTFMVGDAIVYPLHGSGWVHAIVTRSFDNQKHCCYQLAFDNILASVWLPVHHARAQGLRRPLHTQETQQALWQLQQATARRPYRKQVLRHYVWCKGRLRQGDALGLWEVRRFLYELTPTKSLNTPEWRYLHGYVRAQTVRELSQALGCASDVAEQLIETTLLSYGARTA